MQRRLSLSHLTLTLRLVETNLRIDCVVAVWAVILLSMSDGPPSFGDAARAKIKTIVLHSGAMIFLLGGWFGVVFVLQPFGRRELALAVVAILLAWLVAGLRRKPTRAADSAGQFERILGRAIIPERIVLTGALACWLGLIVWSEFSPGGTMPPPPANPEAIRVVTWNILLGRDHGWPWNRHGWPVRKGAIEAALRGTNPDILCVQEALEQQLSCLARSLPGHRRVGVGRDDGRSAGEHCAIFFESERFEETGNGTFWLEEPSDRPPERLILGPKRICTWVRLRERRTGQFFRVYNTHLYLTEQAQLEAVRLILARLASGDPAEALVLAADFNATPGLRVGGCSSRPACRRVRYSPERQPKSQPISFMESD